MRWRCSAIWRTGMPGLRHDAHFGGVLYLFVRGVRPDWNGGRCARPASISTGRASSTLARTRRVAHADGSAAMAPDDRPRRRALAGGGLRRPAGANGARARRARRASIDALRDAALRDQPWPPPTATSAFRSRTSSGPARGQRRPARAAAALGSRRRAVRARRIAAGARRRRPPLPAPLLRLRDAARAAAHRPCASADRVGAAAACARSSTQLFAAQRGAPRRARRLAEDRRGARDAAQAARSSAAAPAPARPPPS